MLFSLRLPALLGGLLWTARSGFAAPAPSICNGQAAFCSRLYSNVSVIGAHNSYSVGAGNVGANQNYTVRTQLDNGIRLLQVQAHMNNGSIHLCHTSCLLLDYGTFTSYLTVVKSWLDANPNEVLSIIISNPNGIAPTVFSANYVAAGMMANAYVPPSVPVALNAWPTLSSMIINEKRVVNFLAQNADRQAVPFLIDQFSNVWETPFGETNPAFPCTVDRVTGSPVGKMYLVNHILSTTISILGSVYPIPARDALATTNGLTSLSAQATLCQSAGRGPPQFTLVDYYDVGQVFQYAAQLNGVPYVAGVIGNGSSSTGSNSTTAAPGAVSSRPLSAASTVEGSLLAVLLVAGLGSLVV